HYEYALADTPCEAVIQSCGLFHVADQITVLFPNDADLKPFHAVSYLGMPLLDKNSKILGHVSVMDTKPMLPDARTESLFRIFAARATAELQRLQAENQIREREEKLSLLVNSAMDAIVELNEHLKIIRANPSAEKVFRKPASKLIDQQF